jgi:hypothetical protein
LLTGSTTKNTQDSSLRYATVFQAQASIRACSGLVGGYSEIEPGQTKKIMIKLENIDAMHSLEKASSNVKLLLRNATVAGSFQACFFFLFGKTPISPADTQLTEMAHSSESIQFRGQ